MLLMRSYFSYLSLLFLLLYFSLPFHGAHGTSFELSFLKAAGLDLLDRGVLSREL